MISILQNWRIKRLLGVFLLVSLISASSVKAQDIVVKGVVKDGTGETLPGVAVKIKGGGASTQTGIDGAYTIKVPNNKTVLVFSFVGFTNVEKSVAQGSTINVTLKEELNSLNEVVVVGYGTQKRSEVTGSIGSIKADQIDQFSGGSLNTSLQGKIAGLQIVTESGEPGAGATFNLRGVSSVNGDSSPLIIIDGVPVNNDTFTSNEDGAGFSPLADINPSDIASIEVLKDAATASIYGSRASNGVVLITTKTGTGTVPSINFSLNSSIVGISRKIGILNGPQFREAYSEAIFNSTGKPTGKVSVIDSLHPYYRNTQNWQDIMYRNSLQYKADVSVSGSSKDKNMNYYVSAGYKNLKPVVIETDYKQVTGAARLNYKVSDHIEGATNFTLSSYNYDRLNTGGGAGSVIFRYLITLPVYNPFDPITGDIIPLFEGTKISPYAQAVYTKNGIKRSRLLGKQELTFHILKDFDFKTSVSVDYNNTATSYFSPSVFQTDGRQVYADYKPSSATNITNQNTLTYIKSFNKKHNINILLGQSLENYRSTYNSFRGVNFVDDNITTLAGAGTINSFGQSESQNRIISFFTRLNYNYKSKYIVSALLRQDGSSRFSDNNKFAYFPSISTGWRFTEEDFFKNKTILSDGKLRVGYGVTGNQGIGNYATKAILGKQGTYLGQPAVVQNSLGNENLKWETTKQLDAGVDLQFLKGRVNLTVDYYSKNTSDLLFNVQIPSQTGFNSIPFNFGAIENHGFDFQLDGVIIQKPFKWASIVTFGLNRNKVTELPNGADYRPNSTSLARVGQPVGVFYGLKALGVYARDEDNVYQTDAGGNVTAQFRKGSSTGPVYKGGDVIYEDLNGDGIINDDDLQVIGNPTPKYFGGWQNTFEYKDFSLGVFFNYSIGNDVFNYLRRTQDSYAFDANFSTDQLRRWRQQGDVTDIPKIVKTDPMENYAISNRFVEDGSFIRLQTVSLGYKVPTKFSSKFGIKNASIGFSAQNLVTWGSYTGYDPEVSSGGTLSAGVDNGSFPKSRFYNLSLNIKL
nr:TonB-dependent receptor [uncultured Pedobacter sp.]